jgi:hypothetical protein
MGHMPGLEEERRRHPRKPVESALRVFSYGGEHLAAGRTLNLSDGGAFVRIPVDALSGLPSRVNITFSVPREDPTPETPEEYAAEARVIRQQPMRDAKAAGVALEFRAPLELSLEA